MIKNKKINVLSLFSGCGGMDLGFEGGFTVPRRAVNPYYHKGWISRVIDKDWVRVRNNAFHTVFANDIRPDAQAAWTNFFVEKGIPKSTYHLVSIVDLVKRYRAGDTSVFPSNIDVVTGGFPCQDFSVAGKRLGLNSDKSQSGGYLKEDEPTVENRGHLYMWMRDVISIVQPKVFYAENVKGLTNLGDTKKIIESDFSKIANGGYIIIPVQVLNAAHYGVPQGRERVIFIGFRKAALTAKALFALQSSDIPDEYNPYPVITHYLPSETKKEKHLYKYVTVREALAGLKEPDQSDEIEQQKFSGARYLNPRLQGQQEVKLDGIGPTIRSEHHGNIEFRRLSAEHGGKYLDELSAGMQERRLTIRECARIQTFPDDYKFILPSIDGMKNVTSSDAYKIIGNAVPPFLAYNLARRLQENWGLYFGTGK